MYLSLHQFKLSGLKPIYLLVWKEAKIKADELWYSEPVTIVGMRASVNATLTCFNAEICAKD
jgi:hypothetical protein